MNCVYRGSASGQVIQTHVLKKKSEGRVHESRPTPVSVTVVPHHLGQRLATVDVLLTLAAPTAHTKEEAIPRREPGYARKASVFSSAEPRRDMRNDEEG